jgi:hypothetical protein
MGIVVRRKMMKSTLDPSKKLVRVLLVRADRGTNFLSSNRFFDASLAEDKLDPEEIESSVLILSANEDSMVSKIQVWPMSDASFFLRPQRSEIHPEQLSRMAGNSNIVVFVIDTADANAAEQISDFKKRCCQMIQGSCQVLVLIANTQNSNNDNSENLRSHASALGLESFGFDLHSTNNQAALFCELLRNKADIAIGGPAKPVKTAAKQSQSFSIRNAIQSALTNWHRADSRKEDISPGKDFNIN